MADPYSEVTRREGKGGLSPLAWFFVILGGFFTIGFMGLLGVGFFFAKKASSVLADFRENPVEAFAELAEVVDEEIEVVATDEAEGTVTLRVRDTGDLVSVDLSDLPAMIGQKVEEGIRFNGEADESGGVLTINTSDGETRIELRGDGDGGFLKISTPDEDMHFGAGGDAGALPRWVPVYPDARLEKRLFSAVTDDGRVGGALLRIDDDPERVLRWYQERMPEGGFTASVSRIQLDDGEVQGKMEWSSREGGEDREVSVVVGSDDDEGGFLLLIYREDA